MNKYLLLLVTSGLLLVISTQLMAQTPYYYAQGEDIDNIINNDEISTVDQLEENILEIPVFQILYRYIFNTNIIILDTNTDDEDNISETDAVNPEY